MRQGKQSKSIIIDTNGSHILNEYLSDKWEVTGVYPFSVSAGSTPEHGKMLVLMYRATELG